MLACGAGDVKARSGSVLGDILLSVPLVLLYDLMIAVVAMLWLVRTASRAGFQPWEKLLLAFCFLVPLAYRYVGEGLGIPIALLALTVARSVRAQNLRPASALDRAPALG